MTIIIVYYAYLSITDICTKLGREHKYHTINTPEWPNSHNLKIQDGGGRHLEFWKSITPDWIKISAPNYMGRCIGAMRRGPHDQKSKPGVNSRDVIKWMSETKVDLSDYNRYLNQIWYITQIPHYQHTGMAKFTFFRNPRWRRPPSWISEKCQ